ncbi:MAG: hypothetical protein LBI61_02345 [Puniceicoccales bacterium]|jgi:hypothetical protein|nr:hypothetical protein [Puniceicoccales bacterium]
MERYCATKFRKDMFKLLSKMHGGASLTITLRDQNFVITKEKSWKETREDELRIALADIPKFHLTRKEIRDGITCGRR